MNRKQLFTTVLFSTLLGASGTAAAGASQADIARLGKDLTPTGAEMAANADGSIPKWSGGETTAPSGWEPGKPRHDFWPHINEKPLYTINESNVDKYAESLTVGQIALLKTVPGYRMDVYTSRRSCGFPKEVQERTKANAANAGTTDGGEKLANVIGATVPFPVPSAGAEVIWNHKMRYMGEGFKMKFFSFISPAKGRSAWIKLYNDWLVTLPFASPKVTSLEQIEGLEAGFIYDTKEPAARIGEKLLYMWYANEPTNAWMYFPGQRRVRRLPGYNYDAPILGNDNTKVVDQFWMFNGAMDRFDWKLIGKRELIVPYNSFKAYNVKASEESIKTADMMPRDLVRYEKHRVWVVEATVKKGKRHIMPKRHYYVDEDSWNILQVDHYDAKG
ncbi:MAG: DUF1329 domain-containing protein, partial [Gammaproteobacteria bacterium]|nr:DUF1329 domain-containing protein [Gammaproteobacteria bacterium]